MPILGKKQEKLENGTLRETGEYIELSNIARKQGGYITGTTGVGKTTILKSLAVQDMLAGDGLCFIDPHGDVTDEILTLVPENRRDDVLLYAPGDDDQRTYPLGLNLMDCDRNDDQQVQQITSTVIDTLRRLFDYSWGPRMEDLLRTSIITLMKTPETTLLDLWLLLISTIHRQGYTRHLDDPYLRQFWTVQFPGYARSPRDLIELIGSSLNKISRFLADPRMLYTFAQPHTAFNLRDIMDQRKILLIKLSKDRLGADNSAFLGSVLVSLLLVAAFSRAEIPPHERVPFHLIVDEFQNFASSDTFSILQSEARKYEIDTIVAHQYRDQLDLLNRGATLNVANFIVLRVSGLDAQELTTQFDNTPPLADRPIWESARRPYTDPVHQGWYWPDDKFQYPAPGVRRPYSDMAAERANNLAGQNNYVGQARLLVDNKLREFTFGVVPVEQLPLAKPIQPNEDIARYIRQQSLKRGTPIHEIKNSVARRIGDNLHFDPYPVAERPMTDETDE